MTARALFGWPLNSLTHVDFLRLPGIITTAVRVTDDRILADAEVESPITICPRCGGEGTLKGDGAPTHSFWDLPHEKPCWVTLRKQLYRCEACKKPCTHDLGFLPSPLARMTTRLRNRIHFLLDVGITYTDISEITGPDERTIRDVRDQRDAKGGKAPEWCDQCAAERIMGLECVSSGFVGLDNWQHGKRKKMRGIFGDVVSRIPIDLFMSVKKVCLVEELSAYFSRHPEVRVIVIDMDMGFRSVIQKTFPWLIIVVDHYHVKQALEKRVSRICDILAETTGREMVTAPREISKTPNLFEQDDVSQVLTPKQGMSKQQKKVASNLRKYRKVFMKRPEKKDERDQNVILACAATYPLLAKVLERRDDFYRIWTTATSSKDAQSKFDEWARSHSERRDPLDETSGSADQAPGQLAELFRSFVAMVQRWRQEIFAFFDFAERPTNAFMESMVKEVKMWNRAGRYVSYPVLRQRFRHHIPKNSTHKRIPVGISTPAHGDETP